MNGYPEALENRSPSDKLERRSISLLMRFVGLVIACPFSRVRSFIPVAIISVSIVPVSIISVTILIHAPPQPANFRGCAEQHLPLLDADHTNDIGAVRNMPTRAFLHLISFCASNSWHLIVITDLPTKLDAHSTPKIIQTNFSLYNYY